MKGPAAVRWRRSSTATRRGCKASPNDAIAHLYDGELHRLQSQRAKRVAERDTETRMARESYEQSAALDPAYPDPFRQLGLLYYQQKEPAQARAAFERYLALKPDAADAKRVREYLGELERELPPVVRAAVLRSRLR